MKRMPKDVEVMLEESGLIWEIRTGKRHDHLMIQGRMVQVLCHGHRTETGRAWQNLRSNIRRVIRELLTTSGSPVQN